MSSRLDFAKKSEFLNEKKEELKEEYDEFIGKFSGHKPPDENTDSVEEEKNLDKGSDSPESKHIKNDLERSQDLNVSLEGKSKALVPASEPETKTFVTQKREEDKQEAAWTINDLLFPGGKISKLCRITNPKSKDIKISDIIKRSGIIENNPVILLSGAEGDKKAGLLVGVARAAYSTDAVIIDNGLKSGIETACFRKKVKLVGVCPEETIVYPTKSSTGDRLGELAAGHSHLFIMGTKGDGMRWDNVVPFKMDLCERIRKGRGGPGSFLCRAVCVLVGDNTSCSWEVEKAIKAGWPVLVIENSPMGRDIGNFLKGGHGNVPKTLQEPLKKGKVFMFPENGTAEHLASAVHLHLAISF
jgi:SLOG in TRPM, prokaryote